MPRLSSGAFAVLERYAWPGNVRELRNVMERAVMLTQSDVIDLVHLPLERLGRTLPPGRMPEFSLQPRPPTPSAGVPLVGPDTEPDAAAVRPGAYSFAPGVERGVRAESAADDGDERERILRALERCAGNQTHAARMLGVSRRTLISRIERYNLPRPRKRES